MIRNGFPPLTFRQWTAETALCVAGFVVVTAAALRAYREMAEVVKLGVALLAAAGLAVVYASAVRWVERRPATELIRHRLPRVFAGALLGGGLVAATVGVVALGGGYRVVEVSQVGVLVPRVGPSLHSAVWEELAFRGLLFRGLAAWLGAGRALAVSATLFGAMHGLLDNGSAWSAVAVAVEAGVLLSVVFWLTQDLWLPIGMHFGWNVTLGGVFGSAVSGRAVPSVVVAELSGPEWLTGGAFGLEASLPAVAICVMATVVFCLSMRPPTERHTRASEPS